MSDHHLIAYFYSIFNCLCFQEETLPFGNGLFQIIGPCCMGCFKKMLWEGGQDIFMWTWRKYLYVWCVDVGGISLIFFFFKQTFFFSFFASFHFLPYLWPLCPHSLPFKLIGSAFPSYLRITNSQLEGHWMSQESSQIRQSLTCCSFPETYDLCSCFCGWFIPKWCQSPPFLAEA